MRKASQQVIKQAFKKLAAAEDMKTLYCCMLPSQCLRVCYAVLRYAVQCCAVLCCAVLRYAMLRYAMLLYAMLCCELLCYAMLSFLLICLSGR